MMSKFAFTSMVAGFACICFMRTTFAFPVPWADEVVHIAAEGKDLKEVIRDFAASQHIAIQIAPNVKGVVTGHFDMQPQHLFDTLAATFGFVWFYDGATLSISNSNDMTRLVVKLNYSNTREIANTLKRMDILEPRFPIVYGESARTLIVTGPAQYVQLIADLARRIDESAFGHMGSVIRVFRLAHAWAADRNVQIDGQTLTVPGVASVLSRMYRPSTVGANSSTLTIEQFSDTNSRSIRRAGAISDVSGELGGGSYKPVNPPLPKPSDNAIGQFFNQNIPLKLSSGGIDASRDPISRTSSLATNDPSAQQEGSTTVELLPVIEADPSTNTVLVRDTSSRIDSFGSLIEALDVKPNLIEIEAQIIEIDDSALETIGVDWRAHNSHTDIQTGTGASAQNAYDGNLRPSFGTTTLGNNAAIVNATPLGLSMTAVLGDAGRFLLARINALQQTSQATIEARPKIATLNNTEATMDNKTRFFVRVQGYTAADLYSVSFGTSLRVLPMEVYENGESKIKMTIHIEDGQFTGDSVDNIPIISTSEINTQAIIGENQSLLIAGYHIENRSSNISGIPILSKIPIIGALFRYKSHSNSHMRRVFLITPRVLSL